MSPSFGHRRARELVGLVDLGGERGDLVGREAAHGGAQLIGGLAEVEIERRASRWGSWGASPLSVASWLAPARELGKDRFDARRCSVRADNAGGRVALEAFTQSLQRIDIGERLLRCANPRSRRSANREACARTWGYSGWRSRSRFGRRRAPAPEPDRGRLLEHGQGHRAIPPTSGPTSRPIRSGAYAEAARRRLSELERDLRRAAAAAGPSPQRRDDPSPQPYQPPGDNRPALTDPSVIREVQERLYNLNYEIAQISGRDDRRDPQGDPRLAANHRTHGRRAT